MVIGSTNVSLEKVYRLSNDEEALRNYVMSLVPIWIRFRRDIVMNQFYYVAQLVRADIGLSTKKKSELVKTLLTEVSISGVITNFVPITALIDLCDRNKLIHMLTD